MNESNSGLINPLRNAFMNNKTILRNYNFIVDFFPESNSLIKQGDFPKWDVDFVVKSIRIPQYDFRKEVIKHGPFPYTYPVLDSDGLELALTLEETNTGEVYNFIETIRNSIVNQNGLYNPSSSYRFKVMVDVLDNSWNIVMRYVFSKCYFLKCSEPEYNYTSNDNVSYDLTLACEIMKMENEFPERKK
jgi:hypothetical protein